MAAVIDIQTGERFTRREERRPPRLRLIEGGASIGTDVAADLLPRSRPAGLPERAAGMRPMPPSSHAADRRTYLLRRVVVVAVAIVALLLVAQAAAIAGRAVAATFASSPVDSGRVHVVRAGETPWEIARRYAPTMDRRDAVDDLVTLNGDRVLRSGQEVRLPASFG